MPKRFSQTKKFGFLFFNFLLFILLITSVYFLKNSQDSRSQANEEGGDLFLAGLVVCHDHDNVYYPVPDVKVRISQGDKVVEWATPDKRDDSWVFESKMLQTGLYSIALDIPPIVRVNGRDVTGSSLGKPVALKACSDKLLCTNKSVSKQHCATDTTKASYDNCFLDISPGNESVQKPYFDFLLPSCGEPITRLESKSLLRKDVAFHSTESSGSQYSPYVMSNPGWKSTPMYYCKNTTINGKMADRVWRTENYWNNQGWINDITQILGEVGSDDDLSCSPGVVIDPSGIWHMYYVAANRNADLTLFIYHATAAAPGINWQKNGKVQSVTQPIASYLESPSPFIIDDRYVLYLTGDDGTLLRMESLDGQQFDAPVVVFTNPFAVAQAGYVSKIENTWYYTYAISRISKRSPPTQIWLATSEDGLRWKQQGMLFESSTTGWDSKYIFTPRLIFDHVTQEYKLYYAGTATSAQWWGSNSTIGFQVIDIPNMQFSK